MSRPQMVSIRAAQKLTVSAVLISLAALATSGCADAIDELRDETSEGESALSVSAEPDYLAKSPIGGFTIGPACQSDL